MKLYHFPLVPVVAVTVFLSAPAIADPALATTAPVVVATEHATKAPVEGTVGQTDKEKPNTASPTGTVKNMAPTRGEPKKEELEGKKKPTGPTDKVGTEALKKADDRASLKQ